MQQCIKIYYSTFICSWTLSSNHTSNTLPRMQTRGCHCSFRLLMMGSVSPETCWASYKYGIINFDTLFHLVGFFCMNFVNTELWQMVSFLFIYISHYNRMVRPKFIFYGLLYKNFHSICLNHYWFVKVNSKKIPKIVHYWTCASFGIWKRRHCFKTSACAIGDRARRHLLCVFDCRVHYFVALSSAKSIKNWQ